MRRLLPVLLLLSLAARVPALAANPALWEPVAGQVVAAQFTAAVSTAGGTYTKAAFYDNNVLAAESASPPFFARITPATDGAHGIYAILTRPDGSTFTTPKVPVTVQRDLFATYPRVAANGSGFVFPDGSVTVAIGENDSYTWTGMNDLYQGNVYGTQAYVQKLRAAGVNVTRMMLEYAQSQSQLLENPIGTYNQKVVDFWDKFLPLCRRYGLTVLITPWDTFWIDANWDTSPYNAANGGPCATKRDFITGSAARAAQKARIKFMVDRWGNSPAVFAWDILNEYDIKWTGATAAERAAWVSDMTAYLQDYELQKWGHRHMTTLSAVNAVPTGIIGDTIYKQPRLDFATTHHYLEHIKNPQNWIDPALDVNYAVRYSLGYIQDGRPYMDTESGPIDVKPPTSDWDDRYYHYMLWAHFASGGAGSGMRWPYRSPHILSDGMHDAQRALSVAVKDFDWTTFRQANIDSRLSSNQPDFILMGCADGKQAAVWAAQDLRQGPVREIRDATVTVKGMPEGHYYARVRSPYSGQILQIVSAAVGADGYLTLDLPVFQYDLAITVVPILPGDVAPDGEVNILDVTDTLRIAAGLMDPTSQQAANADVFTDGRVDLRDALRLALSVSGNSSLER
jgi:mannan endo-1,4-beta-mannosidase